VVVSGRQAGVGGGGGRDQFTHPSERVRFADAVENLCDGVSLSRRAADPLLRPARQNARCWDRNRCGQWHLSRQCLRHLVALPKPPVFARTPREQFALRCHSHCVGTPAGHHHHALPRLHQGGNARRQAALIRIAVAQLAVIVRPKAVHVASVAQRCHVRIAGGNGHDAHPLQWTHDRRGIELAVSLAAP